MLGHTYNGNPISCAVGLKALEIIKNERILENVKSMEIELKTGLSKLTKFNITVCGGIHGERRNVSSMLGNRKQDKAVVSFKVSFWGNVKGRLYDVEFTYSVRKWRKNDDGHYDEWHFKSQ